MRELCASPSPPCPFFQRATPVRPHGWHPFTRAPPGHTPPPPRPPPPCTSSATSSCCALGACHQQATGIQSKWERVKGLPQALGDGRVVSNMSFRTAPLTFEAVSRLREGKAVFTMPKGVIKCPGAGQKVRRVVVLACIQDAPSPLHPCIPWNW